MPRRLAVVTGASSGIGLALARLLLREGWDVVAAGRDAARLTAGRPVACDLSRPEGVARLTSAIADQPVSLLVNNAGFGVHGRFARTDAAEELALVSLQLSAALALSKAVLPGMLARREGTILNVGSVYAFSPVPEQAVYGACKAFLLSWTQALDAELSGTGARALAFCPGIVRTEFRARAGLSDKGALKGMSAEQAAEAAWRQVRAGTGVVVPGRGNKAFALAARLAGGRGAAKFVGAVNRWRGLKSVA